MLSYPFSLRRMDDLIWWKTKEKVFMNRLLKEQNPLGKIASKHFKKGKYQNRGKSEDCYLLWFLWVPVFQYL